MNLPFWLGIAVAFALSGCADDIERGSARAPITSGKRTPPASPTTGNFPPGAEPLANTAATLSRTMEMTGAAGPMSGNPALVLETFRDDLSLCARLIDALRSDVRLADQVERAVVNPQADLERELRGTRAYQRQEFRQLINNLEFVRLEQSHHGDPYAAAVLENRGIICAPTRARLHEIESLGPSVAAWTVREYFLTGSLRGVRMPWTVMDGMSVDFDTLRDEVEASARVYRGPLRHRLEAWLSNAANTLRREQALAESTPDGRTREEHRQTVDEWIIMLESLRSFRFEAKNS